MALPTRLDTYLVHCTVLGLCNLQVSRDFLEMPTYQRSNMLTQMAGDIRV